MEGEGGGPGTPFKVQLTFRVCAALTKYGPVCSGKVFTFCLRSLEKGSVFANLWTTNIFRILLRDFCRVDRPFSNFRVKEKQNMGDVANVVF